MITPGRTEKSYHLFGQLAARQFNGVLGGRIDVVIVDRYCEDDGISRGKSLLQSLRGGVSVGCAAVTGRQCEFPQVEGGDCHVPVSSPEGFQLAGQSATLAVGMQTARND